MNTKTDGSTRVRSIAIDSSTFRSLDFINFLMKNVEKFEIYLPSIVMLEVGYYFMSKGVSWDGFNKQLEKIHAKVLDWNLIEYRTFLEKSIEHKAKMPFKSHFRDFLIGIQCMNGTIDLITFNDRHFDWCTGIRVFTPETFGAEYL